MDNHFNIPDWAVGRFAVVKLWPEIKAAEDENIARMKNTANEMGVKCIEITPDGEIIGSGGDYINNSNCDFVIHLHFETPKAYDVFSFVALWNPLQFYHDWGYTKFSKHLLTHDDFLSCSSNWADDHVRRLVSNDYNHLSPNFSMYHSLSTPIHPPKSQKRKIFYAGINWERLGKGKSRHQELLDLLDNSGYVSIYGPRLFQGVKVWEGYDSYVGEVPFDGTSMIDELSKCGIGLVLSSDAHKQSELMSNRLFECLAAGALPICDENPFVKKHFGDSILCFDARLDIDEQFSQIKEHYLWANNNPDKAYHLVKNLQKIFLDKFSLRMSLENIYKGLPHRKEEIERRMLIDYENKMPNVSIGFLLPIFNSKSLKIFIHSLTVQEYKNLTPILFIDNHELENWKYDIDCILNESPIKISVETLDMNNGWQKNKKPYSNIGKMMSFALPILKNSDLFMFLAPNERLFSSHIKTLVYSIMRKKEDAWAATSVLLFHKNEENKYFYDLLSDITFSSYKSNRPMGFARFIFRSKMVRDDIDSALPYLNKLAISPLIDEKKHKCEPVAPMVIKIQEEFPIGNFDGQSELAVISDYSPWIINNNIHKYSNSFNPSNNINQEELIQIDYNNLAPRHLTFKNLSKKNKVNLFASLLEATLPRWVTKLIFYIHDLFNKN